MEILPLLFVVSMALTDITKGLVSLPMPENLAAAVGDTVMFNTTLTPQENPFQAVRWSRDYREITEFNVTNTTAPEYEGRITLSMSTGSLELSSVDLNDSGRYQVDILLDDGSKKNGSTTLEVYEPISNVTITTNSTDLVESTRSIMFCSCSGSSPSFVWLYGNRELIDFGTVDITDGGTTVIIIATRLMKDMFRCRVSNPISSATSDPVFLTVSYGPENVRIRKSPSRTIYKEGTDITLTCSAVSAPTAQISWFHDSYKLPDTGPELSLKNINLIDSGEYRCEAYNQKTLRYESDHTFITVNEPISNVTITTNNTDVVDFTRVSMFCSCSGSSPSFQWLYGNYVVTEGGTVEITDGGATLTITANRYMRDMFRCRVSNSISSAISDPLFLTISYGPLSVQISKSPSQTIYNEGTNITLTCSAVSAPPAQISWFHDSYKLPDTGPELSLKNINLIDSGEYRCEAYNQKTLRYESDYTFITVNEPISNVTITTISTDLVEFTRVSMFCSCSGSSPSFQWLYGNRVVTDGGTFEITDGGATLTITANRYMRDMFRCRVSNPISSATSDPVFLTISYGPEDVHISAFPSQTVHDEGTDVTLICSAVSVPPAQISWFHDSYKLPDTGPKLSLKNIQWLDEGDYSCEAYNQKTLRYEYGYIFILVDYISHKPGWFIGPIIGTSIGLVIVIIACVLGSWIYNRKHMPSRSNMTGDGGQNNTAFSGSQELDTIAAIRLDESPEYNEVVGVNSFHADLLPSYNEVMRSPSPYYSPTASPDTQAPEN